MATQSEILRFLLQGENKSLVDALNGADAALDGTESSAQRLAAQMSAMAKVIEADGKQAAAATEALSNAMGADLVAAVERSGGSVQQLVAELHQAGAAYDDLRANADQVAASLRDLEAAGRAATGGDLTPNVNRAADGMRRLGSESDQSRSVLANLVGNSVEDLGQLGGIAGSAGVALGQLGEYAADGNISLGNLAKFAGPLAGLGVATWGISAAMDAAAKRAEEAARKAGVLKSAIEALNSGDTTGAASKLVEEYPETLRLMEQMGWKSSDLANTLEGQGYVIRALSKDYDDLQSRFIELDNMKQQGTLMPDQVAEYERVRQALSNVGDVLETLRNDQGVWEEQAVGLANSKRWIDDMNASIDAAGGYWSQYAAAARQSASVANDLADQDKAATSAANKLRALRDEVEAYIAATKNIPDEEITDIRAALDSGNISLVERLLANLTRPRLVNIGVALSALSTGRQVGKGPSGTTGSKSSDPSVAYDAGSVLSGLIAEMNATAGGGGGGGGGGGSTETPEEKAEREAQEFDKLYANLYATGQAKRDDYRAHLQRRLADYATYTDEYRALHDKIVALDREEIAIKKELEDAEKRRQDEAKKAAEAAQKAAEKQIELMSQLLESITSFLTVAYGNLEGTSVGGNVTPLQPGMDLPAIGGALAAALSAYYRSVA